MCTTRTDYCDSRAFSFATLEAVNISCASIYLINSVTADSNTQRRLTFQQQSLTRHKIAFSFSGPAAAGNNLPPFLHDLISTVTSKKHFKTHLYTCILGPWIVDLFCKLLVTFYQ